VPPFRHHSSCFFNLRTYIFEDEKIGLFSFKLDQSSQSPSLQRVAEQIVDRIFHTNHSNFQWAALSNGSTCIIKQVFCHTQYLIRRSISSDSFLCGCALNSSFKNATSKMPHQIIFYMLLFRRAVRSSYKEVLLSNWIYNQVVFSWALLWYL